MGNIRLCDALTLITGERKYLMDYSNVIFLIVVPWSYYKIEFLFRWRHSSWSKWIGVDGVKPSRSVKRHVGRTICSGWPASTSTSQVTPHRSCAIRISQLASTSVCHSQERLTYMNKAHLRTDLDMQSSEESRSYEESTLIQCFYSSRF